MFITEIVENRAQQTLVIYPGRFQPWHKGHKAVYDHLVGQFGRDNVYIATSNKVEPPRSPFNFSEKIQFMNLTGVPADRIVETRDPYRALEIVQHFDPRNTRLILAVSQKDMDENPRFTFGQKKDGTPTYLQPLPQDASSMLPLENHGYIMVVPTFDFKVLGQPAKSATEIRRDFASADDKTQAAMIKDLFGTYRQDIHSLMKEKIPKASLSLDEGQVIQGKFGKSGKYYKNTDVQIPMYDPVKKRNATNNTPGNTEPYERFEVEPASDRVSHIVGITKDGQKLRLATSIDQLARVLVDLYNRGGFTDQYLEKINLSDLEEDAAGVGVIASKKQMNDPRYKMSLTKDVRPDTLKKMMKALRLI